MENIDPNTVENRFKSLIQPIRDLALNWDIDIADELSDYLEELDNLSLDSSEKLKSLNFAEAALLIQGSTAVYSKKVEYLYQLVLQALDIISPSGKAGRNNGEEGNPNNNSNNNNKSGRSKQSNSYLDDEKFLFGSDPTYLLLDDLVEAGANIDLVPNTTAQDAEGVTGARLSLSGDASKSISSSSSLLMSSILQEDHGGNNMRLSTCRVDDSGALIMGNLGRLSSESQRASSRISINESWRQQGTAMMDTSLRPSLLPSEVKSAAIVNVIPASSSSPWGGDNLYDYGGGDDDMNDNYMPPEDLAAGLSSGKPTSAVKPTTPTPLGLRERANDESKRGNISNTTSAATSVTKPNALRLLDPHELTTSSRELKKGKTYRLPASLKGGNKRRKSVNKKNEDECLWDVFDNILQGKLSESRVIHRQFEAIAQQLAMEQRKQRQANRFLKKSADSPGSGPNTEAAGERDRDNLIQFIYREPKLHLEQSDPVVGALWANDNDDDNYGGGGEGYYDDGGNEDGDFERSDAIEKNVVNANAFTGINTDLTKGSESLAQPQPSPQRQELLSPQNLMTWSSAKKPSSIAARLNEEDDWTRRVEAALNDSTNFDHSESSYEALCRRHIEAFMSGAESYARETGLSKRVSEWTKKLEPVLQAQEEAASFDIKEYSRRVLHRVDEVRHLPPKSRKSLLRRKSLGGQVLETEVGFEEIAESHTAPEVCRIFLACLQLANAGNLEICKTEERVEGNNVLEPFGLQILQLAQF